MNPDGCPENPAQTLFEALDVSRVMPENALKDDEKGARK